jgi:hypothetical protein
VLHGQCRLIADEEEHALRQWDLVHLPAGVAHVFVGAGDGPCAVRKPREQRTELPGVLEPRLRSEPGVPALGIGLQRLLVVGVGRYREPPRRRTTPSRPPPARCGLSASSRA